MKKRKNGKYLVFRVYINRETDRELYEQLTSMPGHHRNAHVKDVLRTGFARIGKTSGSSKPDLKSVFNEQ